MEEDKDVLDETRSLGWAAPISLTVCSHIPMPFNCVWELFVACHMGYLYKNPKGLLVVEKWNKPKNVLDKNKKNSESIRKNVLHQVNKAEGENLSLNNII